MEKPSTRSTQVKRAAAVMIAAVICVAAVFLSAFFIRNAAISNSAKGNRDLLPEIRQTPYSIAVFGNTGVKRESITAIDFHDTLEEMPLFGWWDCSVKTNGGDGGVGYGPGKPVWEKGKSIYAWITKDDDGKRLHIAANGTVFALWDSMLLFENYTNLQEINFNGAFDAKNIVSADRMFMATPHNSRRTPCLIFIPSSCTDFPCQPPG